jgi:predicted nucleic acid-binding protein
LSVPAGWLLDTNVVSELARKRPSAAVLAQLASRPLETLFVSVVTLAEIRYGIERARECRARATLTEWLTHTVRPMFEHRVLEVSEDVMLKWRLLVEAGRARGHTYAQPDLIIAATALEHGLMCVTRNSKDFEATGVPLLNPWRQ